MVGTPGFMSPEVMLGSPEVDWRADLYALGCVAYLMLAGRPVFSGDLEVEVAQHLRAAPPAVETAVPNVTGGIPPFPGNETQLVLSSRKCCSTSPDGFDRAAKLITEPARRPSTTSVSSSIDGVTTSSSNMSLAPTPPRLPA